MVYKNQSPKRIDTGKVQAAVNEIASQIQSMKAGMTDSANRHNTSSTKIDEAMERISAAHGRLAAVGNQLQREGAFQRTATSESTSQCQSDIAEMAECLALVQVDTQRVDQKIADLAEPAFNSAVNLERGLEECREKIAQLQHPVEGQGRSAQRCNKNMLAEQIRPWSSVDLSW